MLKDLRKMLNRSTEHCNKELETIKRSRSKLDNSVAEIKSKLEVMNSRRAN